MRLTEQENAFYFRIDGFRQLRSIMKSKSASLLKPPVARASNIKPPLNNKNLNIQSTSFSCIHCGQLLL